MPRLDDIIRMPAEKRRKLSLGKKKGSYRRHPRRQRGRDELLAYLRTHQIRHTRQLEGIREDGDPNVYDYQKEFGSWGQAILVAYGPPPPSIGRFDAKYMALAVIEFGLWTQQLYREKRKLHPDIIPSIYFVYREWGKWSNLKSYAKEYSMKQVLNSYMALWRRLGRTPTLKECDDEGINLEAPIRHFKNKRNMDRLLSELEI